MNSEKKPKKKDHITSYQEKISRARNISKDSFFTWFDIAQDTNESFAEGNLDFTQHILLPIFNSLKEIDKKSVLEIGYGGGRILAAAARFFKNAIGIDIHNEKDFVLRELNERGVKNIELYKTDGKSIPIADCSIDLAYSFIVLQHVGKIEIFKTYLKETYRILKPGGIAILYFGRLYKFSINKSSKLLYFFDCIFERIKLKTGYLEIPDAKVNYVNLKISRSFARKTAKRLKFKVLKTVVSHRRISDNILLYGGQNGIVLKK